MSESLAVLLDQNVPREAAVWLRVVRPSWVIWHATDVSLATKSDREVFEWAQAREALIITFDEHFADQRSFRVGLHHGIVRLRVWPTTIEEAQATLGRLLAEVADEDLMGALVIIDENRIRLRPTKRRASSAGEEA